MSGFKKQMNNLIQHGCLSFEKKKNEHKILIKALGTIKNNNQDKISMMSKLRGVDGF